MPFENVLEHLNHAARMHRSNALASHTAEETARFETLAEEYDMAMRKLSDFQFCALDVDGNPLVANPKV